jgi:hypothetical protein
MQRGGELSLFFCRDFTEFLNINNRGMWRGSGGRAERPARLPILTDLFFLTFIKSRLHQYDNNKPKLWVSEGIKKRCCHASQRGRT